MTPMPRQVGKGRRLPEGLGLAGTVMGDISGAWPGGSSRQAWNTPQVSWGFTGSLVRTGWEWGPLVARRGASSHTPPASVLMQGGLPGLSRPLCVLGCPGSMSAAPPRPGTRLPQPRRYTWGLTGPPPGAGRTGRCGQRWLLVPGRPLLLALLAPACQPAPGLLLVPRGRSHPSPSAASSQDTQAGTVQGAGRDNRVPFVAGIWDAIGGLGWVGRGCGGRA